MSEEPVDMSERWPGYNEQSWQQRFEYRDAQFNQLAAEHLAVIRHFAYRHALTTQEG